MSGLFRYFNGIDAESGEYFEPPLRAEEFYHRLVGQLPEPELIPTGVRLDVCPDSIAEGGWGIVWAGRADPDIEHALGPLLDLRRDQASGEGPGKLWSFDYHGESGESFLVDHGASVGGPVDPERFPLYLLLVGDPTSIPFEFQYRLARSHLVGRLCFDSIEAYARYAANVVAVETGKVRRAKRLVLFGPRHADDPPTDSSLTHLVQPMATDLDRVSGWQIDPILGDQATKKRLLSCLGGPETPTLLFTAGHAVCYRPESRVLQAKQGGLLCSDWPGPVQWSGPNPPDHFLIAEDLPEESDLRGLVSMHFGCFTAGTPRRDSFPEVRKGQITPGRALAPEPFVAALPKRLLGLPKGALACIGHVDRAWPDSFHWGEIPRQTAVFESAFRGLMTGLRVGRAMSAFAERCGTIAEDVMRFWLRGTPASSLEEQAQAAALWVRYYDSRSYVLLGDPAARLPLA